MSGLAARSGSVVKAATSTACPSGVKLLSSPSVLTARAVVDLVRGPVVGPAQPPDHGDDGVVAVGPAPDLAERHGLPVGRDPHLALVLDDGVVAGSRWGDGHQLSGLAVGEGGGAFEHGVVGWSQRRLLADPHRDPRARRGTGWA